MQQMIDALASCRRVLITTHTSPDGDAFGTTAAMALGLARKGIEPQCLILSPPPSKYEFVYEEAKIKWRFIGDLSGTASPERSEEKPWQGDQPPAARHGFSSPRGLGDGEAVPLFLAQFDAVLVCDTGTWSQLPGLREPMSQFKGKKLVLDHHLTQEDWADLKLVDTSAGAAAEIAMELLLRWGVKVDAELAQPLYTAMATDTGWFAFSNTTARTMRLAAQCIEAGAQPNLLYQRLYQSERSRRMKLHALGYASLELLADEKIAVMHLTAADFARTGTKLPATEDLVNWPMAIGAVELSIFLAENPDSADGRPTKTSFRSKGQIDCSRLAGTFGGGGHARAAGAKIDAPLGEARRRVVEAALALLR